MPEWLDRAWLTCPCPRCGYEIEFTYLQARLEETIICPCCKWDVHLVDAEASVEGAKRDVEASLGEFERELKRLQNTLKFKL